MNRTFTCKSCGNSEYHALPRCPRCKGWATYVPNFEGESDEGPKSLREIKTENVLRIPTGVRWFDQLINGGPVAGCTYLLAGSPGAGKSTLMIQILKNFESPLYISGEESDAAIKDRFRRIVRAGNQGKIDKRLESHRGLRIYQTQSMDRALDTPLLPDLIVGDSLHSFETAQCAGSAGTNAQIVEITRLFCKYVRDLGSIGFLIGHVNKEDTISGPNAARHWVDCPLVLETDTKTGIRTLTVEKNRHGPAPRSIELEIDKAGLKPKGMNYGDEETKQSGTCETEIA